MAGGESKKTSRSKGGSSSSSNSVSLAYCRENLPQILPAERFVFMFFLQALQ